jgi:hypothetical protein
MTIKELYEWAKRRGIEDYVIVVPDDSVHGATDSVDIEPDGTFREVLISSED